MESTPADLPSDVWKLILRRIQLKNLGIVGTSCSFFRDFAWKVNHKIHTGRFSIGMGRPEPFPDDVLAVDCVRSGLPPHVLRQFQNLTSLVGDGHSNAILGDVSQLREFDVPTNSAQAWWAELIPKLTNLQTLSIPLSAISEPTLQLASALRVLEVGRAGFRGAFWSYSSEPQEESHLCSLIAKAPHLETVILSASGLDYLDAVCSNRSIKNFSAEFDPRSSEAFDKLHFLGFSHLKLFASKKTFWQGWIETNRASSIFGFFDSGNDKLLVPAMLQFYKKHCVEQKQASLGPSLTALSVSSSLLPSALHSAISLDRIDVVDFLLNTCKMSLHDCPQFTPPNNWPGAATTFQWSILDYAVFSLPPHSLKTFLQYVPAEMVVTSSTIVAALLKNSEDHLDTLQNLLAFAASRGPSGYNMEHYVSSGPPNFLPMRPIHHALFDFLDAPGAPQGEQGDDANHQPLVFMTLFDFLDRHSPTDLIRSLNEPVFPSNGTALHALCYANTLASRKLIALFAKLGCSIYAQDAFGMLPIQVYLQNPSAPWLPVLSPPESELIQLNQSGDFLFPIFKYVRQDLEPLLQHIVTAVLADKKKASEFWRTLFRSPNSNPNVVKYMLMGRWDISLEDAASKFELINHVSTPLPLDIFDLAAESYIDDNLSYQRPKPNDPLLVLLFRLNLSMMRTPDYGRKLLRCLDLRGSSGLLLNILEGHGFFPISSVEDAVELALEFRDTLPVVEYLINRAPVEKKPLFVSSILPIIRDTQLMEHILAILPSFVASGWHLEAPPAEVAQLADNLLYTLSLWTLPRCTSPDRYFWTEVRKSNFGSVLDTLLDRARPTSVHPYALIVALSVSCLPKTLSLLLDRIPSSELLDSVFLELFVGYSSDPFAESLCKHLLSDATSRGYKILVKFPLSSFCVRHGLLTEIAGILKSQVLSGVNCSSSVESFALATVRFWHETKETPRPWRLDLWKSLIQLPDPSNPTALLFQNTRFLTDVTRELQAPDGLPTLRRLNQCNFFAGVTSRPDNYDGDDCIVGISDLHSRPESTPKESAAAAFGGPTVPTFGHSAFSNSTGPSQSSWSFVPLTADSGGANSTGLFKPSAFGSSFGRPNTPGSFSTNQ